MEIIEKIKPTRVVFDSLSEVRLLARDALRYRRQILALKQFFAGKECTVLLLDDRTASPSDLQLQSICHGVLLMEQQARSYGTDRRRMRVQKLRGVDFRSGFHDVGMARGGLKVFPRLVAAEYRQDVAEEWLSSGIPSLDQMLGGGLDKGVSTLLLGPAGSGKSTTAVCFAVAAAARGEKAMLYSFEESPNPVPTLSKSRARPRKLRSIGSRGRALHRSRGTYAGRVCAAGSGRRVRRRRHSCQR